MCLSVNVRDYDFTHQQFLLQMQTGFTANTNKVFFDRVLKTAYLEKDERKS